jgi:methylated-DNA-[protein]-cysteine S-methyltransferase
MRATDLKAMTEGLEGRATELTARLSEAAAASGLLDVGYGFVSSPLGDLLVAVTPRGVTLVSYPDHDPEEALRWLSDRVSPRIMESAGRVEPVRRELDEYFEGRRHRFEVPVDLSAVRGFGRRVLEATARIGFGSVSTYRAVATEAGNPNAYRAAGNALGGNPVPIIVPCHRVVHVGGGLGGYTGGLERKRALLRIEGVLD